MNKQENKRNPNKKQFSVLSFFLKKKTLKQLRHVIVNRSVSMPMYDFTGCISSILYSFRISIPFICLRNALNCLRCKDCRVIFVLTKDILIVCKSIQIISLVQQHSYRCVSYENSYFKNIQIELGLYL